MPVNLCKITPRLFPPKLLGLEGGGVKGKSIALSPGVRTGLVTRFRGETGKIAGAWNMSHFVVVRCVQVVFELQRTHLHSRVANTNKSWHRIAGRDETVSGRKCDCERINWAPPFTGNPNTR